MYVSIAVSGHDVECTYPVHLPSMPVPTLEVERPGDEIRDDPEDEFATYLHRLDVVVRVRSLRATGGRDIEHWLSGERVRRIRTVGTKECDDDVPVQMT